MSTLERSSGSLAERGVMVLLLLLAFLSPGAWLIVTLPPPPIAQALHLAVAAVWMALPVWGRRYLGAGPPYLLHVVGIVLGIAALSLAVNMFPAQQLFYDLYAEMPALLWLAYPAVFLVAARVVRDRNVTDALTAVVVAGVLLVCVMVVWRWTQGFVTTFGSPAFSVPAFAPLPFVALGLAAISKKHRTALRAAALVLAGGLAYAAAGLSALYMLGMGVLTALVVAPGLFGVTAPRAIRPARTAGGVLLALALAGTLVAQVPSFAARVVDMDAALEAEQTVATRLYLWDAAQRMTTERPLLGYGPSGYRFSAVEFYDEGVFPYISALGSDPIAYSAPSPHSLLWEALIRLGVLGLAALLGLFGLWWRRVIAAPDEGADERLLRLSLAVGFVAYLSALLVTPVHFASGLLGAVVAGLAVSPSRRAASEQPPAPLTRPVTAVILVAAIALAGYGAWRGYGLNTGTITGQSFAEDKARVESAARIVPGDPLNERRLLEVRFWATTTPAELEVAKTQVDTAPGYVTGYLPNLVQFAFVGMTRGEQLGVTDYSWERSLLERVAESDLPPLPSLVAEELHLAILEGDTGSLPELMERAEELGATYPPTASYILRAREMLIP